MRISLAKYVNAAHINGADLPHVVVEKLERAINEALSAPSSAAHIDRWEVQLIHHDAYEVELKHRKSQTGQWVAFADHVLALQFATGDTTNAARLEEAAYVRGVEMARKLLRLQLGLATKEDREDA